jgi:hypothetical protein
MKTLLTINGEKYLIPKTTDLSKVLDLLQGIQRVRSETLYGPDDARYQSDWYESKEVLDLRREKVRVEIIHDDEVCTRAEFEIIKAAHEKKLAEFNAAQPKQALPAAV